MEFDATVLGEKYVFSALSQNSFLVSGNSAEYILYKRDGWHCADEIPARLLRSLGQAIEEQRLPQMQMSR